MSAARHPWAGDRMPDLPRKPIEEAFREDIAPFMDVLRKQFEAEDAVLLSMFPADQSTSQKRSDMRAKE